MKKPAVLLLVLVLSFATPAPAQAAITFGLESLGGCWPAQKPAVITSPGRLDAFAVGYDRQLYHYWQEGAPFGLESLGGSFKTFGTAAVSWAPGRRDVFAIGTDNQLYHFWQDYGNPFQHEILGGNWSTGVSEALSWGPGRLDVFLQGNDYQLYHYWFPHTTGAGTTFGLESLGGYSTIWSMAGTSWPGRIDLFTQHANGPLLHFWQNPGEGFFYEYMPALWGQQQSVDAVSWQPGRLDVFAPSYYDTPQIRSIAYVNHYWQNPGSGGWGKEVAATLHTDINDSVTSSLSAVTWGPGRIDFFTQRTPGPGPGIDNAVYHYWQDYTPFAFESLGGSWHSAFSAVSWGPRRLDLFSIGDNCQLYHYWQG